MRIRWTKEMNDKLTELYPNISNRKLGKIFNVSKDAISSKALKLGIQKLNKTQNWTPQETEDFKNLYPNNDNNFLSSYFNRPINKIYQKAKSLNIKKTKEYIEKAKLIWAKNVVEVGKEYRFKKGMNTWNKGIKGFMGANKTSFKKGTIPPNTVEIGTETKDRDGYVKVKVEQPNVWKLKHRFIWENRFGSVPDNHAVIFINGDKDNFDLTNLALVHRRDLLYFNRHGKYPTEIIEAQKLIYQLKNLIKNNGKEQD